MTIDEFLRDAEVERPRAPRTVRQVLVTLAAGVGGVAGSVLLLVALLGSFQGSYSSLLEGEVTVCGYAGVDSACQKELRDRVRTTMHIPLSDDVRVEKLRRYGFPDPIYQARLSYPSASDAAEAGHVPLDIRPGGTAIVVIEASG